MKFQPKTEQEIQESGLWPAGEYNFEIIDSEDAVSSNGNDMIKIKVRIFNPEGKSIILFDYLLEAMAFKLRHCAEACGIIDKYNSGNLRAEDFMAKAGMLMLEIQNESSDKKTGKKYPKKNFIADYIKDNGTTFPPPKSFHDDTVPF